MVTENIRLKIIELYERRELGVNLSLVEDIAELFTMHQYELEDEVSELRRANAVLRDEVSSLTVLNSELLDTLLDTSLKYTDAISIATQQHEAEMRFKEKESREKEIVGE